MSGGTLSLDGLREAVAMALGTEPATIADDDDLLHLGLDSVRMMALASRWRQTGLELKFSELAARPTLAAWWELAAARLGNGNGAGAAQANGSAEPPPVVDESAPFELAPMQHAYWVGRGPGQTLGGVGAHFYAEFDDVGIEPEGLEQAVRALVARHGMLRARFLDDGRQQILPESPWPGLTVHDLRQLADPEAAARLEALRERLSHRKLDVERGEVFDVQLTLLAGGETRIHVQIEMLVADALSFRILLAELAQLYDRPDEELPPLRYSFPRYLAERSRRRAARWERARAYWQERLDELPGRPELPLAVDPSRIDEARVTRVYRRLERESWDRLAERAAGHGLTLPTVFMTAFAEAIGAWSAEPRFLLNLPLYDRELVQPDVAGLVGDFTSLMLVAVDVSEERPFAERARDLQAQLQANADQADYSGLDVLRDLTRSRGEPVSAPVVFTSALSFGELFDERVRRVFGEPGWTTSQTPQVWLDHQVTEREGGLFLNWDAVEGLFREGVLEAMFAAYLRVLDWLAADEADWKEPAPGLLPPEQAAVRAQANATDRSLPRALLHEGFFERAASTPDLLAVAYGDEGRLSYGELAERALHVAGLLREHGVRAGEPVAVTLPKGWEQVAAVLGVLAAGGVYVPVGVDQPLERRARIYRSAGARLVLTRAAEREALEWPDEVEPLTLEDSGRAAPLVEPVAVWEESLAYVIYTSGSTGEPKGVMVPHRAAMNTIADLNERFGIGERDRCLAVSALDFDLSVYDVFGLLSAGGAVVVVDEDARRDAGRWAELVRRFEITLVNCVPALLDMLLAAAEGEGLGSSLRVVLLGGDWVGLDLPGRLAAACPGCRFVALGGTTETAIHSTICEVTEVPAEWRSIPYGTPLANVRCRVADAAGRDRPDWVAGELWIGGDGVAGGYRGDSERTSRQFVERDGVRWYRTGDLARYWPDGMLEFLGRDDFQVKVRGHRIELGEIEAALEAHPDVGGAVATTTQTPAPQLAAVVAPGIGRPEPEAVLRFLADRLPAHMLPQRLLVLDELPLSANGKIDRKEIKRLVAAAEDARGEELEPPQGPVESAVAKEWAVLLDLPAVSRDQSFFALGGDSLLATRLVARLRAAGFEGAELRRLFATPVLKDFAAAIVPGEAAAEAPALVPDLERRHEPFPPTDVQRAYWLGRLSDFTLGGVGSHWYWEFDGEGVDLERLEEAWNRLVARHEMMRAVFDDERGWQRILPSVPRYRIEAVDARAEDGETPVAALRAAMSHQVLDVSRWPLFDVRAVRYGSRTRLGFSFDYILFDALSIMIVFAELAALYADLDAELPPIGLSFRDYVLAAAPDPDARAAAGAYWSARLDELPPGPQLPLATEPSLVTEPRFVRRGARLTPEQWQAIVERARRHGVTPSMVLATAYAEVLSAWSDRPALTLTFTLFDRREVHPDVYNVLGDFTSLLLGSFHPAAGDTWLDAARRYQQQLWADMEHSAVTALSVLRELARRSDSGQATMPVVFTSALGVAPARFDLSTPFGEYVGGLSQTPQVWLDCQVMEAQGGLAFNWDAVEQLFPEGMLDAMFGAYARLLRWLAAPETDWEGPLPSLLPAEQRAVRAKVNATIGPESARLLHEGFFARAAEEPDRLALAWGDDGQLSYGQLAERARRLAGALVEHGLRPGEPVAVTLPKGPDQVVAVLAILYAGGAYVPVGVDQPPRRRERIYASAGIRLLVGEGGIPPNAEAAPLAEPVPVTSDALAYVVYTSGSTGEPKGVMISHRAALNTVEDVSERFGVGPDDRVLAVSALDFDLSVYDVFGLLATGGAVVLPGEDERREARRWVELVERWGVTVWDSVPALLDMLLTAGGGRLPESLRLVMVSGDWVGVDLPGRLAAARPGCRFVALGGATEAAIWSNAYEVDEVRDGWRSIPYGFPLRNQIFRVVDARGRDCPDWVPGELWIGGAGVALGYLGDPETTAARFVEAGGERWYRTGDLGRYWPDGTLEFLGRTDHQIKIRGHRIELGEIGAALEAHPQVARGVALTAGERAQQLAALVVPSGDLDPEALRPFLAQRLPAYMVPERVLVLDELPLTENGKVDREALARLVEDAPAAGDGAPPEGPLETALAGLWAELLAVPEVGRRESFFALGGDSLLATRLVEALDRRFGVELTLRELFATPTVADLARLVGAREPELARGAFEEGVL